MGGLFNKHFWKFFVGLLAIVAAGFFFLVWANIYYDGKNAEQSKAEKYLKDLEKAYKNDTYGGKTPEETLQLFIDALKKGDIDLAAKYFIVEEQARWSDNLRDLETNDLEGLVNDIQKSKIVNKEQTKTRFEYQKVSTGGMFSSQSKTFEVPAGNYTYSINLARLPNGIWKILDL